MRRSWLVVLAAAALFVLAGWAMGLGAGLTRTVFADSTERREFSVERVRGIDLQGIDAALTRTPGARVIWRGAWNVPSSGLYGLALDSRGRSSWQIADRVVVDVPNT